MSRLLIGVFFTFLLHHSSAQVIRGVISDKDSQLPITGVLVKASTLSTISGPLGEFELLVDTLPQNVTVQALGYQTKTITITSERHYYVALESSEIALQEILLTSTPLGGNLEETAASIAILSPPSLLQADNLSIATAINQLPGVLMQQGTLSTNRLTIRGIGSRSPFGTARIRAYLEDIPLTNGNGETTIEDIDLAAIGRVEVIKGPNSSSYGAGLGGAITLLPSYPHSHERSAQSGFQYGSFGTMRWFNRFELGHEHGGLSLIHSKLTSDGYRENNRYERESLLMLGTHRWSPRTKLSFIANFTYLKAFIPSSIGYTAFQNDPKLAALNWATAKGYEEYDDQKLGVNFVHYLNSETHLSASIFVNHRKNYEPRPVPLHILSEGTSGAGYRITAQKHLAKWNLSVGSEAYIDSLRERVITNQYDSLAGRFVPGDLRTHRRVTRSYVNAFAEASYLITPYLRLVTGLNVNQTAYRLSERQGSNPNGRFPYQPIISPRLGLSYNRTSAHFFLNASHGFSPPTWEETLIPASGIRNPDIAPEQGWNFELGTRGQSGKLTYETTGYWLEITDQLVSRRDENDLVVVINAGKTRNIGFEQSLRYSFIEGRVHTLSAFANGSLQHFRFRQFIDGDQDYTGNALTGVPQQQASAGLLYTSENGPFANLTFRYTGKMPLNDSNAEYNRAFSLLNAKVGYAQKWKYWGVEIYAGAQNLLNTKYAGMVAVNARSIGGAEPRFYYPGLPINYFIGLSLKFVL